MVLTLAVPKKLQQKIEREKRQTGLSKSYIVRQILLRHFEMQEQKEKASA